MTDLFSIAYQPVSCCSESDPSVDFAGCVVSGAGAFEVAVHDALIKHKPSVKGRAQLGVQAFADALLIIPKVCNES